jgi:hypothetical protein
MGSGYLPAEIRILILADDPEHLSFDMIWWHSSLWTFTQMLTYDAPPFAQFTVTLGHRSRNYYSWVEAYPFPVQVIPGFRFSAATPEQDLANYDEVWLFGAKPWVDDDEFLRRWADPLDDFELGRVARFMDERKGGIFAAAGPTVSYEDDYSRFGGQDHVLRSNQGYGLMGRLPRVRSMRPWPAPINQTIVVDPPRTPASSFDLANDFYRQMIRPAYTWPRWDVPGYGTAHPLLYGRNGVITSMPDSDAEAQCQVPLLPAVSVSEPFGAADVFEDYSTVEYPLTREGSPLRPELVAESTHTGRGPREGTRFPTIVAYDGHRADVGRVVVDGCPSRFRDRSIIQFAQPGRRPQFPTYPGRSPVGQPQNDEEAEAAGEGFQNLKDYYHNLAIWLAPPVKQQELRDAVLANWALLPAAGELFGNGYGDDARRILEVGGLVRDALDSQVGQGQRTRFALDLVQAHVQGSLASGELGRATNRAKDVDPGLLLDGALGGAVVALRKTFGGQSRRPRKDELEEIASSGAARGLRAAVQVLNDGYASGTHQPSRGQTCTARAETVQAPL